jgi:hypothetical protein
MRKATLLLVVFGLAGALWAADPFVGTWRINPAKSETSYPLDGSFTAEVEGRDNGIEAVEHLVWISGNAVQRRWTAKFDGTVNPVEGDPTIDAISLKKSDPNTINYVINKAGKQFASGKWVVSKDGKTSTSTGSAKIENQVFTYNIFLEKK